MRAGAVTITLDADPAGRYIWPVEIVLDNTTRQVYAGVLLMTSENGSAPALSLDVFREITPGVSYRYDAAAPNSPGVLEFSIQIPRVAWLVEQEMPRVLSKGQTRDAAALQLAIWDIVVDNADGFELGRVRQGGNSEFSSVYAHARNLISISAGQSSTYPAVLLPSNTSPWNAVLMTPLSVSEVNTPEVPNLFLTGCVVVGIAMCARWRRVS